MKSICFLAQFPPPIHGLSKAVETLYKSRLNTKYHFSKIDITNNKRIFHSLLSLMLSKSEIIYFTPSQTRGGNLRDLLFLKMIQLRGKKCIAHIHGGYYRHLVDNDLPSWQRKMNYSAVSQLARGIVLGHSLHNIFEGMLPDNRIFVCPNCVDDAFIAPTIENKLVNIKENGTLHILYLSNFIESKGYREVLELAKLTEERGDTNKFVFHFAGKFFDSKEKDYFMEHSKKLPNVIYHGVIGGKDKVELLNLCQIFVLLSRYPNEGQPISILEAMGNGMAIITTDHAGIPEIASHDNGFACSKLNIDINEIYDYLLKSYYNREKFAYVCQHNYNEVKEKYTESNYINNMSKIFESVCKE